MTTRSHLGVDLGEEQAARAEGPSLPLEASTDLSICLSHMGSEIQTRQPCWRRGVILRVSSERGQVKQGASLNNGNATCLLSPPWVLSFPRAVSSSLPALPQGRHPLSVALNAIQMPVTPSFLPLTETLLLYPKS